MNKLTILIIEDESKISNFITAILQANNYKTIRASNGKEAISMIASHHPDIILLDLGLPDMDGLEILRSIRSWSHIPVIVVSARGREKEKVEALDLGADDYITKPFGTSELLARIRTAVRHSGFTEDALKKSNSSIFQNGGLVIDFEKRKVTVDKREVQLTQIEYKLVTLIAQHIGKVLTYDYIINSIWGPYAPKNNQILRVNMANIRRKIEENPGDPKYIVTEVGVGYRMVDICD
ncbi:MAG: response regulator transcription factor [Clostridia bacterium]|nr:response regulator transcription factor [Clostridia bacterium]